MVLSELGNGTRGTVYASSESENGLYYATIERICMRQSSTFSACLLEVTQRKLNIKSDSNQHF